MTNLSFSPFEFAHCDFRVYTCLCDSVTFWQLFSPSDQTHQFVYSVSENVFMYFRYVVDSGYVKQRQYNPSAGMYSLDVVQISK